VIWLVPIGLIILFVGYLSGWFAYSLLSKRKYDGTVLVQKLPEGGLRYTFEIEDDPENLQYRKEIHLRIAPEESDRE
jgi:hypothetical protein